MRKEIDESLKPIITDLGLFFKRKRLEKNISSEDLAKKSHIDIMTLSAIENGKRNISIHTYVSLCKGLDLRPECVPAMSNKDAMRNVTNMVLEALEAGEQEEETLFEVSGKERISRKNKDKK